MPEKKNIEHWVNGIIFTLKGLKKYGFYVDAAKDYEAKGITATAIKDFMSILIMRNSFSRL